MADALTSTSLILSHHITDNQTTSNPLPSSTTEAPIPQSHMPVLPPQPSLQKLLEQTAHCIPAEAIELLYEAGYETIDAIRTLNVDLSNPYNDLTSAETYTKRAIKPGHKKLIIQFVNNPPYESSQVEHHQSPSIFHSYDSPGVQKRRRIADDVGSPMIQSPQQPLPALLASLERHLAESPVTRHLRKDIDYSVTVEEDPERRVAEGVWRCLVCSSRPVTISLRNGGRQPQLSNVSTHLKTVKHSAGVEFRKAKQQFMIGDQSISAAAIAAVQKHFQSQQQQSVQQQHEVKQQFMDVNHMSTPPRAQMPTAGTESPQLGIQAQQMQAAHQIHEQQRG